MLAYFTRLISAIRRRADLPPEPERPQLNRKERRAQQFARSDAEKAMRYQRSLARIQRRKRKAGVTGGDHGAKSRRAYLAGRKWGLTYTVQKAQQAYLLGLGAGRKQRPGVLGFASRIRAMARALVTARPIFGKTAAQ